MRRSALFDRNSSRDDDDGRSWAPEAKTDGALQTWSERTRPCLDSINRELRPMNTGCHCATRNIAAPLADERDCVTAKAGSSVRRYDEQENAYRRVPE